MFMKFYTEDAPEDEEEMDSVDGKRVKRRSESAHQKMEEDERRKSKKKAKVLVEVSDQPLLLDIFLLNGMVNSNSKCV